MALDFDRIRRNALKTDVAQYPGHEQYLGEAEEKVRESEAAQRYVPLNFGTIRRNAQRTDEQAAESTRLYNAAAEKAAFQRRLEQSPTYQMEKYNLLAGNSLTERLFNLSEAQPTRPAPQPEQEAAPKVGMGELKAEIANRRMQGDYGPYTDLTGPGYTSLYSTSPYYGKGNINLGRRPLVADGDAIATVRSMSFQDEDGKEVLIPTVIPKDGRWQIVSDEEAIAHYRDTGEYLGRFDTVEAADAYAQQLHQEQEAAMRSDYQTYGAGGPPSSDELAARIQELENKLFGGYLSLQGAAHNPYHGEIEQYMKGEAQRALREEDGLREELAQAKQAWSAAKQRENEELHTLGWRDASAWDLLGKSVKRGYLNSVYGMESYKDMMGWDNKAQEYADKLEGEEFRFITDGWWQDAVSGAAELGGQQLRQATDPRAIGYGATAAGMAAVAGQLGPQVVLPEEIVTVPSAFFAGWGAGNAQANFEIEAGLAYRELVDNGVSADKARLISSFVGGVNAALEGLQLDEVLDSVKILNKSGATQSAAKRLLDYVGHYAANVGNETAQEVLQEATTIAGAQIGQKLETGEWAYSADEVGDRLKDTAISSAMSFGVAGLPGAARNVGHIVTQGKTTAQVGAQLRDMDAAQAVIEEGLQSGQESESYRLAQELRQAQERGEQVSDEALGALYRANVQEVAQEERTARDAQTDAELTQERQAQEDNRETPEPPRQERADEEQGAAPPVPYAVRNQQRDGQRQAVGKTVESLGRYGQKAYETAAKQVRGDSPASLKSFSEGFTRYYDAGVSGLPLDRVDTVFSRALNRTQRYMAYMAGTNDAAESLKAQKENARFATSYGKEAGFIRNEYASGLTRAEAETLNDLGKALGRKITFAESVLGGAGNGVSVGGTITVARDAKRPVLEVARHEITHELQMLAPAEYRQFRDYAIRTLTAGNATSIDLVGRTVDLYAEHGITLTREEAMDELAADLAGKLLTDEATVRRLIAENRTVAEKFRDALHNVVEKVKGVFRTRKEHGGEEQARQAAERTASEATGLSAQELTQAAKLWDDALRAASEQARQAEKNTVRQDGGKPRYSLGGYSEHQLQNWAGSKSIVVYEDEAQLRQFVQDAMDGKNLGKKMYFGTISPALAQRIQADTGVDVAGYNCSITAYEIRKILKNSHGNEKAENLRGQRAVTVDDILAIPDIITGPDSITLNGQYEGRPVIQFAKEIDGRTTVVSYASQKHHDLTVQTMFAGKKKGSLAPPPSGVSPLSQTSETTRGTASTNSIPQGEGESKYSLKEDIGYHAGDLGKAESLWNIMSGDRSTGHFGTGTYFVGDEAQVADRTYGKRPHQTVDFSKYHLYRPSSSYQGRALHEFLKALNYNLLELDSPYQTYHDLYTEKLRAEELLDTYEWADNAKSPEAVETARELEALLTRALGDNEVRRLMSRYETKPWAAYEDLVKELRNEFVQREHRRMRWFEDASFETQSLFGLSEERTRAVFREVFEEVKDINLHSEAAHTADSISTRFMKKLGYEGIDVRGLDGLDNTKYGSVIYDLKGEDAARKAEIGTARYSLKDADALEREVTRLTQRNEALREQFRVSKGARMDKQAVGSLARAILADYSSAYDKAALEGELHHLFAFIANGRDAEGNELTYAAAKREALGVARNVLERSSELDDQEYREYRELRSHMRGTRLTLDAAYRADLDMVGGYEAFRRANFGRFVLGNSGVSVDVAYQELSGRWPGFFPDTITHPADQLIQIADVLEGLRPAYENPYSSNLSEAAEFLATDLLERFYDVPQAKPTYADKAQRRLTEQVIHDAKVRENLRQRKNQRIEQVRDEGRERVRQVVQREAAKRREIAQKLKAHYAQVKARERNRRNESAERSVLLKVARRLERMKTTPQNRAAIDGLVGELDLVAKGITGQTVNDLQALENWYRDLQDPASEIYDPDFIRDPATEAAIARLKKKHIAEMDMGDVRELTQVLLSIEHEIRTERKLLGEEEKRDIYHLAEQSMMDVRESKGSKAGSPFDAYNTLSLSALREFRRLTGYREDSPIYRLALSLNDGQRRMMDFQMRSSKLFDELVRDKAEMERFTGKKAKEIPLGYLKSVGGEPVAITPAMRVSLYLHSRNAQNLLHIKVGGVVVPDLELYRKGNLQEAYARGAVVKLRPSEVRRIVSGMTAKEKAFAERAYQFFNKLSKDAINETSLTLNGYEKAMVDDYFPIRTSRNFNRSQFESLIHDGTIEGMGILKEREVRATNPVVLEDVTAVLMRQIDNVGRYYGLAVPVRNFNKVWNVTTKGYTDSVKQAVENVWGAKATRYVENLMTDLQNGRQSYDSIMDRARGNFAQAVLALNISVTMKQAASYPTAAGVIGWRPLVRAFADLGPVNRDLVAKYTPLLWYREQGGSSTELGDVARRKGWADKLPALMGWIQKADVLTVAKLWKASEYSVQETRKDLTRGTDAYYRAVADTFNRVVEESQPNYTVMQRPDVLRTPNQGLRAITMFSTQRMQNYNMLYDAVGNWSAKAEAYKHSPSEANLGKVKEARRNLARNVSAQLAAAATISAMTLAASMLLGRGRKYEDDDEDEITLESLLAALADDFAGTLMGSALFGADAYNAIKAVFGAQTWYDIDNPSVTMLNDVVSAAKSFWEAVEAIHDGEADAKKIALKANALAAAVSKFAGIPLENVEKLAEGLARRIFEGVCGPLMGRYYYAKYTTDTSTSKGKGELYDLLWQAKNRDAEVYDQMLEDMVASGFDPDSIQSAMDSRLRNSKDYTARAEDTQAQIVDALAGSKAFQTLPEEYQAYALEEAEKYARAAVKAELTDAELTGWMAKADDGERVGLEPWEYILYRAALERYNEGPESITQDEAERAAGSISGLTRQERAYLWQSTSKSWSVDNNPYR